jgi:hypothetical protein
MFALVGVVVADERSDLRQARAHFAAGEAAYSAGHYQDALRHFKLGNELAPRPRFLVNIGQCYRKLHQPDKALEAFQTFLANAPDDQRHAEVQAEIEKLRAEIAAAAPSVPPASVPPASEPPVSEPPATAPPVSAPPASEPSVSAPSGVPPASAPSVSVATSVQGPPATAQPAPRRSRRGLSIGLGVGFGAVAVAAIIVALVFVVPRSPAHVDDGYVPVRFP